MPVSFSNGGLEAATQLILDTGATHTVIYRSFASQLNILSLATGQSKVASGQSVLSEVGKVDFMKVGPIRPGLPRDHHVLRGPPHRLQRAARDGFPERRKYVLDYENQVIRWKLRGN